ATTAAVDSKPRRCDCKDFPPTSVATTRSVAASTRRTRRFSLAHPPRLTPPAHPEIAQTPCRNDRAIWEIREERARVLSVRARQPRRRRPSHPRPSFQRLRCASVLPQSEPELAFAGVSGNTLAEEHPCPGNAVTSPLSRRSPCCAFTSWRRSPSRTSARSTSSR